MIYNVNGDEVSPCSPLNRILMCHTLVWFAGLASILNYPCDNEPGLSETTIPSTNLTILSIYSLHVNNMVRFVAIYKQFLVLRIFAYLLNGIRLLISQLWVQRNSILLSSWSSRKRRQARIKQAGGNYKMNAGGGYIFAI